MPGEGTLLGRASRGAPQATAAPNARQHAQPGTATGATVAVAERGRNTFQQLTSLDNLFACWREAKRAKGHSLRIQRFGEDPLRYLSLIQERLRDRSFRFGPYRHFTVREKKFREVVDAPMKDRVVHWMLYRYLLPIWRRRFIHDTYGNLPERGTHAAVRRVASFARRPACRWVLQLDISKYFHSVPHVQLKARVLRYIGDESLRRLIASLVDSYRTDDRYDTLFAPNSAYRTTAAKGMPIGNLSSQLFANIYLDDFDHWVKQTLGVRHYVRYVDDLVFLAEDVATLQAWRAQIVSRLATDGLTVHPHKVRIAPARDGIPFLGYVIWPEHVSAGQYLRHRYHRCLRDHERRGRNRHQALQSYRAALAHTGATRQSPRHGARR